MSADFSATIEEHLRGALQGVIVRPAEEPQPDVGVLVLAGSSGRIDVERARLLARAGALALRWCSGPGQAPGVCEIPLERFIAAIDRLHEAGAQRIGVIGLSKGAEAALLIACRDPRISSVVAISPTPVVWANVGAGTDGRAYPYRSSWTWLGEPLPFVPYDETWEEAPDETGRVAYRTLYERSLRAFPDAATRAAIPIETAQASLLLVAGAADALWPSDTFAAALAERRELAERQVEVITHPQAGHRPTFPGEPEPTPSARLAHGGTPEADAALGRATWPRILAHLGLPG